MDDVDRSPTRTEHDSMGEVQVPEQALYRAQTQRAVENFPISGHPLEPAQLAALARIKAAAATVNARLGVLPDDLARSLVSAAQQVEAELTAGGLTEHFPVDVFQTGSGTSSNMNMNEVLATLATRALGREVHPNDHVNASQSSNDVFPTSIHLAATTALTQQLLPALDHLAAALERQAERLSEVVKSGRTHLMDATPVTLGQEFGGYAAQVRYGIERLQAVIGRLAELPLGGTAVGTGINTPAGFAAQVVAELGEPFTEARNHFEAQGARDALAEVSGQLRTVAVSLVKICNDLRWMGSGPRAGLGEIRLPDLQPGSSIMPGKVNPVLPEAVLQVCAQVIGNDATIGFACASGSFELNVMMPVMGTALLQSLRLLSSSTRLLADRCIDGIEADVEHCRALAEGSPSIVTPLNRYLGYEEAAAIAKQALAEQRTIREVVLARGHVPSKLTEQQLDAALDVLAMTRPPA